jgi:hypothetical protein
MLIGYIMTNDLIKLYSWDNENNRAIVYILKKIESTDNFKSNKQLGLNTLKNSR